MDPTQRIEQALEAAILTAQGPGCPPGFAQALRYAVFPGGARIRPRLCQAVAWACGDSDPQTTDAAAAAIELLHCASLVHDDLPCFDDSPLRRGRPSVHCAYGERLAVLAGDALIVLAFEILARRIVAAPLNVSRVMATVASCTGAPIGICAGQAWECESDVVLADYHRAKTGSLFVAAAVAGAESVGAPTEAWRLVGERLGEAYQVADDLGDAMASSRDMGKPLGRDSSLGRPNAVQELGVPGAVRRLKDLVASAAEAVPPCQGAAALQALIAGESRRILPEELAQLAA
ncbi:MAG TPA: polyprenyl synthetase family protein [Lamprocystis sp. (in: g-proteobacteria)]|nr:polyprenyl synthetase family protein [Lamprocystis sp. (in: g-proteobacteria)]